MRVSGYSELTIYRFDVGTVQVRALWLFSKVPTESAELTISNEGCTKALVLDHPDRWYVTVIPNAADADVEVAR